MVSSHPFGRRRPCGDISYDGQPTSLARRCCRLGFGYVEVSPIPFRTCSNTSQASSYRTLHIVNISPHHTIRTRISLMIRVSMRSQHQRRRTTRSTDWGGMVILKRDWTESPVHNHLRTQRSVYTNIICSSS